MDWATRAAGTSNNKSSSACFAHADHPHRRLRHAPLAWHCADFGPWTAGVMPSDVILFANGSYANGLPPPGLCGRRRPLAALGFLSCEHAIALILRLTSAPKHNVSCPAYWDTPRSLCRRDESEVNDGKDTGPIQQRLANRYPDTPRMATLNPHSCVGDTGNGNGRICLFTLHCARVSPRQEEAGRRRDRGRSYRVLASTWVSARTWTLSPFPSTSFCEPSICLR